MEKFHHMVHNFHYKLPLKLFLSQRDSLLHHLDLQVKYVFGLSFQLLMLKHHTLFLERSYRLVLLLLRLILHLLVEH